MRAVILRQSRTYSILLKTYRDAWLDACLKQLEERYRSFKEGEVFECAPGEIINYFIRDRLNDYGLVINIEFVISKYRKGVSFEILYKHYNKTTVNLHRLNDKIIRKDKEGKIASDRVRNRDNGRTGY